MKKYIFRLLWLVLLFMLFLGIRELLATYLLFKGVHPWLGYSFIVIVAGLVTWLGIIPAFKLIKLPKLPGPYIGEKAPPEHLQKIARILERNPQVKNLCPAEAIESLQSSDEKVLRETIDSINKTLSITVHGRRKLVVNQVFLGTALSQNGVLDALIMLGRNISLISYIYKFYNGRPDTVGLIRVYKSCIKSVVLSSGADSASDSITDIALHSIGIVKEGGKGLPFVGTLIGSFSNGFINAAISTRLSLIAEAYCTKLEIKNERELAPPVRTVIEMARHITGDMKDLIIRSYSGIDRGAKKIIDSSKSGVNEMKDGLEKAYESATQYLKGLF